MKNKKVLIACSKSITINVFLDDIINKIAENNSTYVLCSDPENIKKNILNKNLYKNLIKFKLFDKYLAFFNIFKIIFLILKIRNFFNKNPYDIIFLHTPLISHLVRLSTFGLDLNICYFVHGFRFHKQTNILKYYFFYLIERFLSLNTKSYIVINKEDLSIVKNKFNINHKKINGIGINFNKDNLNKLNLKSNIVIGFIAAYRKNKGYDDLINIAKKLPYITFNCYGYDNYKYFQTKIIKNSITNINLNKFDHDIYSKIDKFHLLLSLSEREGLSTSIIECLHRGKPVIGYNIRGVNDLIKNYENGILADFKNLKQIIYAIEKITKNEKKYIKYCNKAFESIDDSYNKINSSVEIINFLDKC